MSRYNLTIEDVHDTLTECNGRLRDAASALKVPLHTIKSIVDEHAELQAIVRNRSIEILDRSEDIILGILTDEEIPDTKKESLARWAAETLGSDRYSKSQTVDLNTHKRLEEMSEEELEKELRSINRTIEQRLSIIGPAEHEPSTTGE